jgi:ATP synthase protein I
MKGAVPILTVISEHMVGMSSESDSGAVILSLDEKARLAGRARRGLFLILFWQAVASILVAFGFLLFVGLGAAVSSLVGAACYLFPQAIFVLRLALSTWRLANAEPKVMLVGYGLKMLVTLALLWLIADVAADKIDWLAMVVGLVAALKGYWVALLVSGGRVGKKL